MSMAIAAGEKPVIRRSLAESLLTCAAFEREDSEVLAFGTAAHSFFAAYVLLCKEAGEETRFTDVARLASEAWARTPGLLQGRHDEFMKLAERWAQTFTTDLATLTHLEHTQTLDVGDLILTATMDRIDRMDGGDPDDAPTRELITDHKTERAELDHAFQERWYVQLRLLANPALRDVGFQIAWSRDGVLSDKVWYRRGELDLWWKTMLAGLRERLALPDPQPVGGPACMDCAKRYSCAKAVAPARLLPENDAQAEEILQDRLRLAAGVADADEALKRYLVDRPALVAAGHEVGFLQTREPSFSIEAPASKLLPWLRKKRMDMDAMLKPVSISNRGLQDDLIEAGLAVRDFHPATFKIRKHVAERKKVRHEQ